MADNIERPMISDILKFQLCEARWKSGTAGGLAIGHPGIYESGCGCILLFLSL